ncbi:MAG: hypothetical protein MJB14_09315 [Spirochaetes bacterium]|nr:hypothetical protein [Spirochaetota bacterium]
MKKTIWFILIFINISLYSEKWVGQLATYQLKEGTQTKSGEFFNSNSLTAACNGFRLGAVVTVTNIKTGKQVEVKINDRITDDSRYFMLLTPSAAKELGMEWETSLAVINASFNDVNSTEYLPINGLVAEGSIDEETIKKFPDVKWPDEQEYTQQQAVKEDEKYFTPLEEHKISPFKQKEKTFSDLDVDLKEEQPDQPQDQITRFPDQETQKTPNKIMEQTMIDDDIELAYAVPEEDKIEQPDLDDQLLDTDQDLEKSPQEDTASYPERETAISDSDYDFAEYPQKETSSYPERETAISDSDYDFSDYPQEETYLKPEKDDLLIMDSDQDELVIDESLKMSETMQDLIHENQKGYPEYEDDKVPNRRYAEMDHDFELIPKTEKVLKPQRFERIMDSDELEPQMAMTRTPEQRPHQMDKDSADQPQEDTDKVPDRRETETDVDKEAAEAPLEESKMYPQREELVFDEDDYEWPIIEESVQPDIEHETILIDEDEVVKAPPEKEPDIVVPELKDEVTLEGDVEWHSQLAPGKVYIRFMTTFNADRANAKLELIKQIIPSVYGLKQKNKYILLVGPVDPNTAEEMLKGIRNFGFRDAYIVKGR